MITYQASVSKGWLHKNGGFEFVSQYYLDPLYRLEQDREMNEFVRKAFQNYPVYNMEANLMQSDYKDDHQVLIGGIQPNLILAFVLGADFVFYPDKDMDVNVSPLKNISDASVLPSKNKILNHPFIKQLDNQISILKNEHPDLKIVPPFFWDSSGRATIHGILTTSFKLIGDNALTMIVMNPDLLHAVHQWITEIYIFLVDHFSEVGDIGITSVHVGECSGTMVANNHYKEFINPYINKLGQHYRKVRLHSCGLSNHILEAISAIENLEIIDTGSNTSIAKIRELRSKDFMINVEPPVELMLNNSNKEDIMGWLEKTLEENKGGKLKFVLHLEPGYSEDNCLLIYDELIRRKLIK